MQVTSAYAGAGVRPAAEPPLLELLALPQGDRPHADESMYLLVIRLIDRTPSLLAA